VSKEADEAWEAAQAVARRHRAEESERRVRAARRKPVEIGGAPRRLLLLVAEITEYPLSSLLGLRRSRGLAEARQLAYLACRRLLRMSYPEVGAALGRDHTTVLAGVGNALRRAAREPRYQEMLETIERRWNLADAAE
jgi:chromosomal replication initiation ATPase DnaA